MPGPLLRLSATRVVQCRNNGSLMIHSRDTHPGVFFGLFRPPIKAAGIVGSSILSIPLTSLPMAQSTTLSSGFDPLAVNFFTNGNALKRNPPPVPPSQYPRHIASSQYTSGVPAHMQSPRQSSSTSSIIHSPEPRRPTAMASPQQSSNSTNQRQQKQVFDLFQQDRASPDLEEILLRKKLTQALGPVALGLDAKRNAYPPS